MNRLAPLDVPANQPTPRACLCVHTLLLLLSCVWMVCVGGNQFGYALRKPLNLPTSLNILEVTKGCLPLFLFDRRMEGDPLRCQVNEWRCSTLQDTNDTPDAK